MNPTLAELLQRAQQQMQANRYLLLRRTADARLLALLVSTTTN